MNSTTQHTANAAADKNTAAYQQAVNELVDQYCVQNSPYYRQAFARISGANRFILSFNLMAALLGPVWFAARGLWNWFLVFVLLEAFACIQISLGLFSDLGLNPNCGLNVSAPHWNSAGNSLPPPLKPVPVTLKA
ncbi:DUF2628 domain-containing protein [Aliamphritea spongicola]|nr:DUF2628 domain-containing protein [Aliamphritea spongicola]